MAGLRTIGAASANAGPWKAQSVFAEGAKGDR
ncbi:hypothetical protein BO443_10678 [Burkholderia orbicola]